MSEHPANTSAHKQHLALRAVVEAALMLALAYALDNWVPPFYRFPQGGSIDLSLVPILIYGLRWGPKWSLMCCVVNGFLQFFLGNPATIGWQSMLLDYIVAYTLVFPCGFAAGKKLGWLWGTILAFPGRWLSLTLSGALLWYMYMPEEFLGLPMTNPWVYSAFFNGVFCVLVLAVSLITMGLLQSAPAIRKQIFTRQM